MKTAYIVYNKRSCVTGRALFDYLKAHRVGGYNWRRTLKTPTREYDLLLRWGNSTLGTPTGTVEINTRETVNKASDKLKMMRILNETAGVTIPEIEFNISMATPTAANWFYRNSSDQIKYRQGGFTGDKYRLKPITKTHEYRVHVFDGNTLGIYEKVPHEGTDGLIRKDNNCDFLRRDMSDETYRRALKGARPMCKAAVEALGLVYGGVDIIKDSDGKWYVLEVNSSPALNEPNIERWGQAIGSYLGGSTIIQQQAAERAATATRIERERLDRERIATEASEATARRNETHNTLIQIARERGFEIEAIHLIEV